MEQRRAFFLVRPALVSSCFLAAKMAEILQTVAEGGESRRERLKVHETASSPVLLLLCAEKHHSSVQSGRAPQVFLSSPRLLSKRAFPHPSPGGTPVWLSRQVCGTWGR